MPYSLFFSGCLGIVGLLNRKFVHVQTWNEPGVSLSLSTTGVIQSVSQEDPQTSRASIVSVSTSTSFSVIYSLLKNSQNLQRKLAEVAHQMEVSLMLTPSLF
jgi:hypothetical protein